jgi:peptidyl-prolyl cis-trans isomerase C
MSHIAVNGVIIPDTAIDQETQYHPASSLEEARTAAARALAIRELLRQVWAAKGYDAADEDAALERLIDDEVQVPEADDETCRRYYDNNRGKFRSPDLFEACHILLPAHPDDTPARDGARMQAEALIDEIRREPAVFAELARIHSACPSGQTGGNLGQITRGQTVPEFETFLVALEPGQLCPVPVPTPYGYHILRLDRRIDGRDLPFEAVRTAIAEYLREHAMTLAVRQYIQLLAGQASLEGIDLAAAASPLVQ